MFVVLDSDSSGRLSVQDLTESMSSLGKIEMKEEEMKKMIANIEIDGDCMVGEDEFIGFMSIRPKSFTAQNEVDDLDPDYMYEVPLLNKNILVSLRLHHSGISEQLVKGCLFSTRMSRELDQKSQETIDFKQGQDCVCIKFNSSVCRTMQSVVRYMDMMRSSLTLVVYWTYIGI